MFADVSPFWGLGQSGITALSGLGGVLIGSWMTARNQRADRKNARLREQLQEFYSPMAGMRAEIEAKNKTSEKLFAIAKKEWHDQRAENAETKKHNLVAAAPTFLKLQTYDYSQFTDEVLPLYRKMQIHFSEHRWLAEPSTLLHYAALAEFVEIWDRQLKNSLEPELTFHIDHSQESLVPLYDDIERHFVRLCGLVGGKRL